MAIPGLHEAPLSVQENALAYAMLHRVGNATVSFVVDHQGDRTHQIDALKPDDVNRLAGAFASDPKESLAWARESLFAINQDTRLSQDQRDRRLGRYLDAYSDLTIKLDRAAFPPTGSGVVREGVPNYIPDGFVDMGRERSLDATHRDREQIVVDKHEILTKYRPLLMEIFQTDYSRLTLGQKKLQMANKIGNAIWEGMTDHERMAANGGVGQDISLGGGRVRLSELSEGVCRHQSLVFQVLAQAVGIKSIPVKGRLNGQRHAANMIRVDKRWYIYDVANPVYVLRPDGSKRLRPSRYPVDSPPPPGGTKEYVVSKFQPNDTRYSLLNEMYWRIGAVRR